MAPQGIRLAVFNNDSPAGNVIERYGTYGEMNVNLLRVALEEIDDPSAKISATYFDTVNAPLPSLRELSFFDGVLLTGSSYSAYSPYPWITNLVVLLRQTVVELPELRLIGICFGHQILARALGGRVELNPGGWELGTTEITLTGEGARLLGITSSSLNLQQFHRDHVSILPPNCVNLGHSTATPCQGFVKFYFSNPIPASFNADVPQPSTSIHVLALQGHPEFSEGIVNTIVEYADVLSFAASVWELILCCLQ